tara:strand:+ start:2711 stop:2974 length:264 start_codon:yes stop_codon:yes gene_type:complete
MFVFYFVLGPILDLNRFWVRMLCISLFEGSFASEIIRELTFLTMEVATSTQRVFEVWVFVAGMYFVISFACAFWFSRLEKRMTLYQS